MTAEPAVEAAGLTKSFGGVAVLRGVDLTVPGGSRFALLGPNGAGKTTIVRILSTLTRPDGGTARVAGCDIARDRHRLRRRISLTGQYAALDGLQTGAENLRMAARLAGLRPAAARRRAAELLEQFDLGAVARRRAATYSGGMLRRLDLAAGLVAAPSVIFLDEPTTGLDLPGRLVLWQVITGLSRSGVTVFLTTQYLEEADQLADRVAIIDDGRVVADGTPAQLKRQVAAQRLELTLASAGAFDAVLLAGGGRVVHADREGRSIGVATDGTAPQVRSLLSELDPGGRAITAFSVRGATLDDVFLALTGPAARAASDQEASHA